MPHYFRLEEAEKLLPQVEKGIQQAIHLKEQHELATFALQRITERIHMMGGVMLNREDLLGKRAKRDATALRLNEIIEEIHAIGCQIKDLDTGLIDFPTMFEGDEVLLCWKLGENGITHWHGVDEGFGGRKRIDEHFRANHGGDSAA
jgi:hypothetical protein